MRGSGRASPADVRRNWDVEDREEEVSLAPAYAQAPLTVVQDEGEFQAAPAPALAVRK